MADTTAAFDPYGLGLARAAHLRFIDLVNGAHDVLDIVSAHEALEQLLFQWEAASRETLAQVDRQGLAHLLGVLNVALRQRVQHVLDEASAAHTALPCGAQDAAP